MTKVSRRAALSTLATVAAAATLSPAALATAPAPRKKGFQYCLNASTIRGQQLGIVKELEIAAKAGYDAMEVWVMGVQKYVDEGGKLPELKKRIDDLGIKVVDAIGFAPWIAEDAAKRKAGLEQAKREMEMLAAIGCPRLAAPPMGATDVPLLDLDQVAERFYALIEVGKSAGVMPQLEVWGFSKNLHKLSQVLYVAAECGHPDAKVLLDVYHLYRGGSDIDGLKLINGACMDLFHMNDYPSGIDRGAIQDKDRVHTGDGIAQLKPILKTLHAANSNLILSLELFNPEYWKQDALMVAKEGLAKMKQAVANALQ